jgi:hypothetical protein
LPHPKLLSGCGFLSLIELARVQEELNDTEIELGAIAICNCFTNFRRLLFLSFILMQLRFLELTLQ